MSGFNVQLQLAGVLEWMSQQMAGWAARPPSSASPAARTAPPWRPWRWQPMAGTTSMCADADGIQPDIDYSQALVEHLQIPTAPATSTMPWGVLSQLEQAGLTPSRQTVVNLPSRIRMATLYAVASRWRAASVNTSNLSEDWVGYCTIYGDSAGASPLWGMYTTEEVIALGRALGLPERFLIKPPPTV